ncbi:uncharacterized protein [Amphiura filiformis]|uniref:uncharacterized protein n=1 Tax=Amphiura filiformis TaxID=82378 RepID=UPI003B227711
MGFVPSQSWRMVLWPDLGARGIAELIVTEDGCIPVAYSFRGEDNSQNPPIDNFQSVYMFNFTRGIDDTDKWFKLPDNCAQLTKNKRSTGKGTPPFYPPFFKRGGYRIPR